MKLQDVGDDILREVRQLKNVGPIWPGEYGEDTPEAAYAFVMQCKTYVESARGPRRLPDKEYIRWITHYWWWTRKFGKPLVIWKSRRLMVSWILRCLRVWDCGMAQGFVQVGARTFEGPAGARQFVWRCWFIYDWLMKDHPQWKLKALLANGGNPKKYELESIVFPNGSLISAINLDAEGVRGSGASAVEMEELNFTREVAATWTQGITVCSGPAGEPAGHPVTVNNTNTHSEWLAMKRMRPDWDDRIPKIPDIIGCKAYEGGEGNVVLQIHFTCDPEKRSATWIASDKTGKDLRLWKREMDMDEQIFDGVAVYSSFAKQFHYLSSYKRSALPFIPTAIHLAGWDVGNTTKPAFLLNQLVGRQLQALLEIIPTGAISMEDFAPYVIQELRRRYPELIALEHLADESGRNRQGATKETSFSIAAGHGLILEPMTNNPDKRIGAVSWFLQQGLAECRAAVEAMARGEELDPSLRDAQIGYIVDDVNCPVLAAGFLGGYKMAASSKGDSSGPGLILQAPLKNDFSHIHDCQQYIAMRARQIVEGRVGKVHRMLGSVEVEEVNWNPRRIRQ